MFKQIFVVHAFGIENKLNWIELKTRPLFANVLTDSDFFGISLTGYQNYKDFKVNIYKHVMITELCYNYNFVTEWVSEYLFLIAPVWYFSSLLGGEGGGADSNIFA